MDDIALARALHVLAVIHWIGGLAFVTLIVLPMARSRAKGEDAVALFEQIERRFSAQVRISIPLVGLTGFWMTWRFDLWSRFFDPHFWWMDAMLCLWLLFMLMLFVIEPLAHRRAQAAARKSPDFLRRLFVVHVALLGIAVVTVLGAVAGEHGLNF